MERLSSRSTGSEGPLVLGNPRLGMREYASHMGVVASPEAASTSNVERKIFNVFANLLTSSEIAAKNGLAGRWLAIFESTLSRILWRLGQVSAMEHEVAAANTLGSAFGAPNQELPGALITALQLNFHIDRVAAGLNWIVELAEAEMNRLTLEVRAFVAINDHRRLELQAEKQAILAELAQLPEGQVNEFAELNLVAGQDSAVHLGRSAHFLAKRVDLSKKLNKVNFQLAQASSFSSTLLNQLTEFLGLGEDVVSHTPQAQMISLTA